MKITLISAAIASVIATWAPISAARETVVLSGVVGAEGVLNGVDTTGPGTLTIGNNQNININNDLGGALTSNANDTASLVFLGNSTVTGFTGTNLIRFLNLSAGAVGSTVNFNGDVFATTSNVSGTGTINFNGNVISAPVFAGDGFINLAAGRSLTGAITTNTANTGTLTLNGGSSVTGAIGGASGLKQINVVGGNAAVTGAVQAQGFSLGTNTLTITGALTTNVGGTIQTSLASSSLFGNIQPSGASNISATGITVIPTVTGVLTPGTNFRIVNGLAGTIGATVNVINTNPLYTFVGVPTTTGDVNIRVVLAPALASPTANAAAASILGFTALAGSDLLTVQNAIVTLPNAAALTNALSQLSPNSTSLAAPWVAGQATHLFEDIWRARVDEIQDVCCDTACDSNKPKAKKSHQCTADEQRSNWWGKGFGSRGEQDDVNNLNGFDTKAYGLVMAYDRPLNPHTRLGFGAGYANTTIDENNAAGRTEIDSFQIMSYLHYQPGTWFVQGALTAGVDKYEGSRQIQFTGVNRTAESDYDGQQYSAKLTAGKHFYLNNQVTVTPHASLQVAHTRVDSYTESGAGGVNLRVDSQDYNYVQSGVGVKIERVIQSGDATYAPEVHVKWLHDFKSTTTEQDVAFTGGGASFNVRGVEQDRDMYNVGVGMTFLSCNCDQKAWTVKGLYDYKWNNSDYASHQLAVVAGFKF